MRKELSQPDLEEILKTINQVKCEGAEIFVAGKVNKRDSKKEKDLELEELSKGLKAITERDHIAGFGLALAIINRLYDSNSKTLKKLVTPRLLSVLKTMLPQSPELGLHLAKKIYALDKNNEPRINGALAQNLSVILPYISDSKFDEIICYAEVVSENNLFFAKTFLSNIVQNLPNTAESAPKKMGALKDAVLSIANKTFPEMVDETATAFLYAVSFASLQPAPRNIGSASIPSPTRMAFAHNGLN